MSPIACGAVHPAGTATASARDCPVRAGYRGHGFGLAPPPLSGYFLSACGRAGLHLGYAGISEPILKGAVRRLAHVIREQ